MGFFMLFSEFREKEVICVKDCKRLGRVGDLEFDECTGHIHKICIPGKGVICNLFNCEAEYVICYKDIKRIGPDIILVDI